MNITFTKITNDISDDFMPQPASKFLPDWYRNTPSYKDKPQYQVNTDTQESGTIKRGATIKKCMPVFDAMTAGYIVPLPVDIFVTQQDGHPWYQWSSSNFIEFHGIVQAPTHPMSNGFSYPKFMSPWLIKTPPGYSCLFLQPLHRASAFNIIPGVIDTDSYLGAINFPFVLNDLNFEGILSAGAPMVQVIPFKRESWKRVWGGQKERDDHVNSQNRLNAQFFNVYKNIWRHKKEYL